MKAHLGQSGVTQMRFHPAGGGRGFRGKLSTLAEPELKLTQKVPTGGDAAARVAGLAGRVRANRSR
jgi:hypothetical protein